MNGLGECPLFGIESNVIRSKLVQIGNNVDFYPFFKVMCCLEVFIIVW